MIVVHHTHPLGAAQPSGSLMRLKSIVCLFFKFFIFIYVAAFALSGSRIRHMKSCTINYDLCALHVPSGSNTTVRFLQFYLLLIW